MLAVVFDGQLGVRDVPLPDPSQGEALIRVRLAGICGTDLEIARGYKAFRGILGHEFVGDVIESPDPIWVGTRVCGEINVWCGTCSMCLRGVPTQCEQRTVMGILERSGAFADYVRLPLRNLHPVPESVPDERAVFAEPLAAAFQILEQVDFLRGQRVAVLGDGRLGILCAMAIATTDVQPVLIGRHAHKLALAARQGIETLLVPASMPDALDVVVEATGSASGFDAAQGMLRPRGTLVLKSTTADPATVDLASVVVKELTIIGSRCGSFEWALDALASGVVNPDGMVDSIFSLAQGVEAMERAVQPGVIKVLLHP